MTPLVPLMDDEPFEASLALEWPVEGLEPLSFVLARVSSRWPRAWSAPIARSVLHTELHLTSRTQHRRTLQLPSPMRDPKTLRTLILLDLDRILPTPPSIAWWSGSSRPRDTSSSGRCWTRQPSPEQVSTLLARLSALMAESHVARRS